MYLNRLEVLDPEMTENPLKWFPWLISTSIRRYINVYSMLFAKFFCAKSKARCWSVRFKEWLDKKKKIKNISKSPENNAAWKVEDIDEFGQNQLILMRNRCETAIGAAEAMQRRAKIHSNTCLKKKKRCKRWFEIWAC